MFLGGLKNIGEFLSDYKEWHAAVIGFAEGFLPWMPEYVMSKELNEQVTNEYHYYVSAMALGYIVRILAIAGVIVWGLSKVVPLFIGV